MKACEATPDLIIPVGWSSEVRAALRRVFFQSFRLDSDESPFLPMIALQAYAEGKGTPPQSREVVETHPFHSRERIDDSCYPYLEGSDIEPYRIRWSGSWLRYGSWLAEPQSIDRFSGPRIVIREILGTPPSLLRCALLEETMLYNKSVLHILPRQPERRNLLLALLAVLNSSLASFIILQRGRKSQRKLFPKVVNDDLKDFPIPFSFFDKCQRLAGMASDLCTPDGPAAEMVNAAQDEIDREVFKLYRLKPPDIEVIQNCLRTRLPS